MSSITVGIRLLLLILSEIKAKRLLLLLYKHKGEAAK